MSEAEVIMGLKTIARSEENGGHRLLAERAIDYIDGTHAAQQRIHELERELAEALAVLLRLYDIFYGASDGPSMGKALEILERHGASHG